MIGSGEASVKIPTIHRFRTKRQFWSYCGLGIVMRSSSDWVQNQAKQGQRSPIYVDYERLLENGTKPNLAKVTMARKIAATVLRMWKDEEVYRPNKVATTTKAAVQATG